MLVDKTLFDHDADHRANAATFLSIMSGVKTMYESKDNQYEVFTPSQEEREERIQWKSTNAQVGAMRNELLDQPIAITNRSIIHIASLFVLFSRPLLFKVNQARENT